jgi:hypothetical protein
VLAAVDPHQRVFEPLGVMVVHLWQRPKASPSAWSDCVEHRSAIQPAPPCQINRTRLPRRVRLLAACRDCFAIATIASRDAPSLRETHHRYPRPSPVVAQVFSRAQALPAMATVSPSDHQALRPSCPPTIARPPTNPPVAPANSDASPIPMQAQGSDGAVAHATPRNTNPSTHGDHRPGGGVHPVPPARAHMAETGHVRLYVSPVFRA